MGDLFLLNFLTIVTEFIGVSLALGYFGISPFISVPVAALGLIAMTATGSFRRWERFMFIFVAVNFLAIPLVILVHPRAGPIVHGFLVPGAQGGMSSTAVLLIIAIVGTTVAPWQLFFQQSNIVDKRITPRWINYERVDTVIGSLVVVIAATALVVTAAFAFMDTPLAGHFTNAEGVARGLAALRGAGHRSDSSPSCCSTPRSSAPPRSHCRRRTPSGTFSGSAIRSTAASGMQGPSTRCSAGSSSSPPASF